MTKFKMPIMFGTNAEMILGEATVDVSGDGQVEFRVVASGPMARPLLDVLTSEEIVSLSLNVGIPTKDK